MELKLPLASIESLYHGVVTKEYPLVSRYIKNTGTCKVSEHLDIAVSVLENNGLYSEEQKLVLLLRVLSTLCTLTNQESSTSNFSKPVLDKLISITNLLTHNSGESNCILNNSKEFRLDLNEMKQHLKSLKILIDVGDDRNYFRPEFEKEYIYTDTLMASSTNIYLAKGIFNLYEMLINNIADNSVTAVANEALQRAHRFISKSSSSLPNLIECSNVNEFAYKDMYINDNTFIINWVGTDDTILTISPESIEAVTAACIAIEKYSKESGKKFCHYPSNKTFDEYAKELINFGRYCELYSYFRKPSNRLVFEGYLQTIIFSLLKVEEFDKREGKHSTESDSKILRNKIFDLVDFIDNDTPVEQIYANRALNYINVHKDTLCNGISKFSQSSNNKPDIQKKTHLMLNISKSIYNEAKIYNELGSFITKLTDGADFEVRKEAPENFHANVANKVYVASLLLQFAVMEKEAGMDMIKKLLRLNADPRVENLQDGMSAIGIALLYEDFAEEFLQEITKRRYYLTETKIDINKCLIASDLRNIDEYSNNEVLMSYLKQLYYFTEH